MGSAPTKITSVITYLEMSSRLTSPTPPRPALKIALMRAEKPTVSFYRYMYNTIGQNWLWWERRKMSDKELLAIITNEIIEIYVLYVSGVPAGYGELDRRIKGETEIAYFGLMPEFIGQGLGGYFLRWIIDEAWSYNLKRLFVHTCTEDHPAAIHNYQRHGFSPYYQVTKEIVDPRNSNGF
jgi:GNAT superfamily N-acetyltransferase